MLTVNIDVEDRLVNGQLGTVIHIAKNHRNEVFKIYVQFDDNRAGFMKTNTDIFATQHCWVPIDKTESKIKVKLNKDISPVIQRTQFPLLLSRACTSHKVQGLSLDSAVLSFDLFKQKSFNDGQMYVALSRMRSLSGLTLTGTFIATAVKADPRAIQEYERLRLESLLLFQTFPFVSCDSLAINLLSVKSLHKHSIDIACDQRLLESDLLCFIETQVLIEQNTDNIKDCLRDFVILHNTSPDRFQSIAFCYKRGIDIVSHVKSTGISCITFQKPYLFNIH